MVDRCVRCSISGNDVRLFDAIYEGKMESICERCSIIENIPIIKKPSSSQLKESEKAPGVYDRMKRMSGIRDIKKEETFFIDDKLDELEKMPELELPEREKLNLIEHFHWHIMKNRRKKGLTQEQLAKAIGESEIVIIMMEKGKLPENAEVVLRKLEQFFQFKLKKISEREKLLKEKLNASEPILLDKFGKELDSIPEPEFEVLNEQIKEEDDPQIYCKVEHKRDSKTPLLDDIGVVECKIKKSDKIENEEVKDLEFKELNPAAITISDLREIHRKKIQATKQEMLEEQKRIEEKQRLIEAKKEELRLLKEKESNELSSFLGGVELIKKDKSEFEEY